MKFETKKNIKNQEGQVSLLIVLIIMFSLSFISLSFTDMIFKQTKTTKNIYRSTQSYYLADTGAEILLYKTRNTEEINPSSDSSPLISIQGVDFNGNGNDDGFFEVTRENSHPLRLKIVGIYENTARAVELSW